MNSLPEKVSHFICIMSEQFAALFDLDGVIINTEILYLDFWKDINEKYFPNDPNMKYNIRGVALSNIYKMYFKDREDLQEEITDKLNAFEREMKMEYVPDVLEFVKTLREEGVKTAIVTSSNNEKMKQVFKNHPELKNYFDVIVNADLITKCKPNPECYLLAAKKCGIEPENCFVFEDSFHGMKAGRDARMKVIALSTTNSAESIERTQGAADLIIPDFIDMTLNKMLALKESESI